MPENKNPLKVIVGADHRGFALKTEIIAHLKKKGYAVTDAGIHDSNTNCDYPKISSAVATKVARGQEQFGILICMTGIGQAIAANKVPGAYAALCYNAEAARLSRQHNNANILVLGAKFVNSSELETIIDTWLTTSFEGGRHQRRLDQIRDIENGNC